MPFRLRIDLERVRRRVGGDRHVGHFGIHLRAIGGGLQERREDGIEVLRLSVGDRLQRIDVGEGPAPDGGERATGGGCSRGSGYGRRGGRRSSGNRRRGGRSSRRRRSGFRSSSGSGGRRCRGGGGSRGTGREKCSRSTQQAQPQEVTPREHVHYSFIEGGMLKATLQGCQYGQAWRAARRTPVRSQAIFGAKGHRPEHGVVAAFVFGEWPATGTPESVRSNPRESYGVGEISGGRAPRACRLRRWL